MGAIQAILIRAGLILVASLVYYIPFRLFRFSRLQSAVGGIAAVLLSLIGLKFVIYTLRPPGQDAPLIVIGSMIVVLPAAFFLVMALLRLWQRLCANWQAGAFEVETGAGGAAMDEERRIILNMLAEGKVSAQEAEELLKAAGAKDSRAGKPVAQKTWWSFGGALLVALGFALPWFREGGAAFQVLAGYEMGALGWGVFVLGLLPALLLCIPVLEKHVLMARLRLLLASCGLALIAYFLVLGVEGLMAPAGSGEPKPGIGLFLVLLGFGAQFIAAAIQSGLLRRSAPVAQPSREPADSKPA